MAVEYCSPLVVQGLLLGADAMVDNVGGCVAAKISLDIAEFNVAILET